MTFKQQLELTIRLSIPAVVAQISYIVMQYIDASASIGLVSTSTWLFWGVCVASATGFSVQVAHHIGAKEFGQARAVLRQSFVATTIFSLLLTVIGVLVSTPLPAWLGGDVAIQYDASSYFLIFILFLPVLQLNFLAGGMLRCSGNMHVPSMLNVLMCIMDVVFNFFLIYPSRELEIGNISVFVPGAGLGVEGAALGTGLERVSSGGQTWKFLFDFESINKIVQNRSSHVCRAYCYLRSTDLDNCYCCSIGNLCYSCKFFCNNRRKLMLYAGVWYC